MILLLKARSHSYSVSILKTKLRSIILTAKYSTPFVRSNKLTPTLLSPEPTILNCRMTTFFTEINQLPPDPLFGLKARMAKDTRPQIVDLGIGAYRDSDGKPWVLPSVKAAETRLQNDPLFNHEYLPIGGNQQFLDESLKILFGSNNDVASRTISSQTLSGTGALHFAGIFLNRFYNSNGNKKSIYLSDPTWANHKQIFQVCGFETKSYPYWNGATKSLRFEEMLDSINQAPEGSIFLLHAVAHNPTGLDPTKPQWNSILDAIAAKNHFPIFDIAYQGFASGSLEEDSYALRLAIEKLNDKTPLIVCQSFAKNLGLYGERTGAVHLVMDKSDEYTTLKQAIKTQFNKITRSELSNPPAYGSKVAALVLSDPVLRKQWEKDLVTMSSRIGAMRKELTRLLHEKYKTPGNWDHISTQIGMFSFTGLTPEQVQRLEVEHAVYLTGNGRASVAGLNSNNVDHVAKSIDEVVRYFSSSKL